MLNKKGKTVKTDTFSSEHYVVVWEGMKEPFEKRAFSSYTDALRLYDTKIGEENLGIDRFRVIVQTERVLP